jgi:hypothetical protein
MGCAAWLFNAQSKYQKQKQDFAQTLVSPKPKSNYKMRLALSCHYPNWISPNGLALDPMRLAARKKARKQKRLIVAIYPNFNFPAYPIYTNTYYITTLLYTLYIYRL